MRALALVLLLVACGGDDTPSGYALVDVVFDECEGGDPPFLMPAFVEFRETAWFADETCNFVATAPYDPNGRVNGEDTGAPSFFPVTFAGEYLDLGYARLDGGEGYLIKGGTQYCVFTARLVPAATCLP